MGWLEHIRFAKRDKPSSPPRGKEGGHPSAKMSHLAGLVATGTHRLAAWQLDHDHRLMQALESNELPAGSYVSFCKDDWQSAVERSAALTLADLKSDIGESVYHLVMSHGARKTDPKWVRNLLGPCVYATPRERLSDFTQAASGVRLIPGMALMRELLSHYHRSSANASNAPLSELQTPFVTGLLLRGAPGRDVEVLILMRCSDEGRLEDWDYIPLSGVDTAMALSAFVQTQHMSASGEWPAERTLIFSEEEISVALASLKAYPTESAVFGVPLSALYKAGALALGGAAVASLASTGVLAALTADQRATLAQLKGQTQELKHQQREELVVHRLGAYLATQHVKPAQAIDLASALWLPGASISLNATAQQVQITAVYQNNPAASSAAGQAQRPLLDALSLDLPQGCTRESLSTSNTLQHLEVKYHCQTVLSQSGESTNK